MIRPIIVGFFNFKKMIFKHKKQYFLDRKSSISQVFLKILTLISRIDLYASWMLLWLTIWWAGLNTKLALFSSWIMFFAWFFQTPQVTEARNNKRRTEGNRTLCQPPLQQQQRRNLWNTDQKRTKLSYT